MKRNLELIRNIFFRIEEFPQNITENYNYDIKFDGFTKEEIDFHLYLMKEAKFVEGIVIKSVINKHLNVHYDTLEITWAGYEFLDSIRNRKVWQSFKKKYANLELPFSIITDVCKVIIQQVVLSQIK